MGFNYSGPSTTQAHKHSNASSDGGSLDSTTLLNTNDTLEDTIWVIG